MVNIYIYIYIYHALLLYVLVANDCFQLGIVAFKSKDYYHAHIWLNKTLQMEEMETVKTVKRKDILEYFATTTFRVCLNINNMLYVNILLVLFCIIYTISEFY